MHVPHNAICDDVLGILAWNCRCPQTKSDAHRYMLEQSTYPTSMQLLREPIEGWFPFLKQKCLSRNNLHHSSSLMKNFQPIVDSELCNITLSTSWSKTSADAVARITCALSDCVMPPHMMQLHRSMCCNCSWFIPTLHTQLTISDAP